ncbi:MAG: tetratricopeptide repeat protein [Nitrosomonadales bacterium]|nr:tetratricopeptide repeat protein [Nitrosomonadales bacterium]
MLYRSYLWMTGIFIVLPLWLSRVKAGIAMPVMLLMILAFAMGSINRLTTFSDPVLLWHDAAKLVEQKHDLPGVWRIYENRAISFLNVKRSQQAIQDYRLALSLSPRSGQKYLYQGLGAAYIQESKYADAVSSFGSALELDSGYDQARYSRGVAYMMMGDGDSARADLTAVCKAGRRIACDKLDALGKK